LQAEQSLKEITMIVEDLERRLADLQNAFLEATDEKARVEGEALNCETRLSLAERLVTGLHSENLRWGNEVEGLKASKISLIGDVLLSSSFVSYIGAFDAKLRDTLWRQQWLMDLTGRAIPLTDDFDPLHVLTNAAEIATWSNQGLPQVSTGCSRGAVSWTIVLLTLFISIFFSCCSLLLLLFVIRYSLVRIEYLEKMRAS
jgi:dynein heavy chain